MDVPTAECADVPCRRIAFAKICLYGDVGIGSGGVVGVVRHPIVPPVEELLDVRRPTLEVINDDPGASLHWEAIWSAKCRSQFQIV